MAAGEDLIKYITEKIVKYIDTPREERKTVLRKNKEPWQYRWFGMLPMALRVWRGPDRKKRNQEEQAPPHSEE